MALKTLFNEMEFLAQYPMVGMAISDSPLPTPAYLFGEINAITYIENGRICRNLVNFLVSRLQNKAPMTSMKVLKLLLYLVKNGHTEMLEELRHHEISLKEARSFSGTSDNLHGSIYYENIRKMAKELLELIFTESKDTVENASLSGHSDLVGYGSSAKSTSQKMTGFGYSVKTQKSVSEVVSDGFTKYMDKILPVFDSKIPESIHMTQLNETLPQYKPLVIQKSENDKRTPVCEEQADSTVLTKIEKKVPVHVPGRPGGCWDDPEDYEIICNPETEDMTKETCSSVTSLENGTDVQNNMDWLEEYKIVEEFTVNKALHELEFSAILSFCKRCSSLNCDEVLKFLHEKFFSREENVQLRALIFLEYLMFHDVITLESVNRIIFSSLEKLFDASNKSIKKSVELKAKKIYLIIKQLNNQQQQKKSSIYDCRHSEINVH